MANPRLSVFSARPSPATATAALVVVAVAALSGAPLRADIAFTVSVDPSAGRAPISPYIYGTNQDLPGVVTPVRRQGGNRMTGYNWETNASNAGSDWFHNSDNFLTWAMNIPTAQENIPGIVVTKFHDQSLAAGTAYSVVTLPMAGYVAADKSGEVTPAQVAPSSRWKSIVNTKPSAFSLTPNTTDASVYTDELLNLLIARYGGAATPTGIKGYNLDNEPDLWSATHARLHPAAPTCVELVTRSVDLAKTIKRLDPAAETLGFVSYGFLGYYSFQNAPDWSAQQATGNGAYRWFVDYYLAKLKQASDTAGARLLDVLDVHHYSEHQAGGDRVSNPSEWSNTDCNKGRIQAPRALWDTTFTEASWIGQWFADFLPYLPNLQSAIATHYPGTKLALTEYNYGGESHISGGIAQADTLGIFGRRGVHLATWWQLHDNPSYIAAAFNLFLNFDGAGGKFGDTRVAASVPTADNVNASAFAAIAGGSDARLHLVVLNKHYDQPAAVTVQIAGATRYTRARVFAFDSASAALTERAAIASIVNNQFTVTLPKLTAAHLVLESADASFASWVAANFTLAEQAAPAISGPDADPDRVGVSNFARYAFSLPARGPLPTGPVNVSTVTDAGQRFLAVSFTRKATNTDGLAYKVEGASTLPGGWSEIASLAPGVPALVTVHDSVAITPTAPARFLRVRAVQP